MGELLNDQEVVISILPAPVQSGDPRTSLDRLIHLGFFGYRVLVVEGSVPARLTFDEEFLVAVEVVPSEKEMVLGCFQEAVELVSTAYPYSQIGHSLEQIIITNSFNHLNSFLLIATFLECLPGSKHTLYITTRGLND